MRIFSPAGKSGGGKKHDPQFNTSGHPHAIRFIERIVGGIRGISNLERISVP
jgi:hypothetical protein